MTGSVRARAAVVVVALLTSACAKPPPPKPPPPPPPPAAVEAPPPPKCESLTEGCTSKADTRARVPDAKLAFTPPAGWTFAAEAEATVATKGRAAIAIVSRPITNRKNPPRAEALLAVVERLGATFPKSKKKPKWPRKADRVLTVGALQVSLFQLDGAKREDGKGPVLVFSTVSGDDRLVVGGGFVPEDDDSNADTEILAAIQSLAPDEADAAPAGTEKSPPPP